MRTREWIVLLMLPFLFGGQGVRASGIEPAGREEVSKVAESAFRDWIDSMPVESLPAFGFAAPDDRERARVLPPIPFLPPRRSSTLDRAAVEAGLSDPVVTWWNPVAVGEEIVCLVVVETAEDEAPRAVEFGKTFAANRLDAALRHLGGPGEVRWDGLRVVSFAGPNVDLLLAEEPSGGWRWLNLLGTVEPRVEELEPEQIAALLKEIRQTAIPPL